MHKTPYRATHDVTQPYPDGVLTVYAVEDVAAPGYQPVTKLTPRAVLRYEERRLGVQRYYQAMQNQIRIQRVLRVPMAVEITNQDVAIDEKGRRYRVDMVQSVDNVRPASVDLTLVAFAQTGLVQICDKEGRPIG